MRHVQDDRQHISRDREPSPGADQPHLVHVAVSLFRHEVVLLALPYPIVSRSIRPPTEVSINSHRRNFGSAGPHMYRSAFRSLAPSQALPILACPAPPDSVT